MVFCSFLPRDPLRHLSVVLMRENSDAKSVGDTHTTLLSISWAQLTSPRQPSPSRLSLKHSCSEMLKSPPPPRNEV